jgi:hypothetical protein
LKKLQLRTIAVVIILVFAGVVTVAFLSTQTSCTYQTTPGGSSHLGQQTYWEKLVAGLCHPLPG